MAEFSAETLSLTLSIIGIVIVVSALLSGLIERSGFPQVAVFLALGAALGPYGLGVLDVSFESPVLRVVATLSLALVLFTDAVGLNIKEVRRHSRLAFRVLGPGTLFSAAILGFAAWWLLDLSAPLAAILGAAVASTDPVLLRGIIRRRDIPDDARHALRMESGLNDIVLLPVVIVAMAFLNRGTPLDAGAWARLGVDLFILGPGAGILVGLLAVAALDLVRRKIGVRRDYESLYSLGVAFTAFAAAEAVHGSGYVAAFAAGITIAALDVELCDCFVEYGEVTAEMLLLFTFVLFGSSLIWTGLTLFSGVSLLFAAIALIIRVPIYSLSLIGSGVSARGCRLIAWFGPRGLSSLLLIMLPIFAGLPGSHNLFAICSLVVLLSVLLHGGAPFLFGLATGKGGGEKDPSTPATAVVNESAPNPKETEAPKAEPVLIPTIRQKSTEDPQIGSQRISIEELRRLRDSREAVTILDVRTERSMEGSTTKAQGAVRLPPDNVVQRAGELGLDKEAWLIAYCA